MKLLRKVIIAMFIAGIASVAMAKEVNRDGEIIAYMQALNNHEISVSKVARDKKVDADVMKYADMMIEQHGENLQQVTDISDKIDVAADETKTVKKFDENGAKDLAKLTKLDDTKFQKAYIKAMINGHESANKMLKHFEKEVQNPELKQYVINTKAAVEQHLAEAKELR